MAKDIIEQLLEDQGKVENQDIKDALEDFQKEQSLKNKKKILDDLRTIEADLSTSVSLLRSVRTIEKLTKSIVTTVNDAKEQYMKDGDWNAYKKAVGSLSTHNFKHLVMSLNHEVKHIID